MHVQQHAYSFLNAADERIWVKFTFRTQQASRNLTDAERGSRRQGSRKPSARLVRKYRVRHFPTLDLFTR